MMTLCQLAAIRCTETFNDFKNYFQPEDLFKIKDATLKKNAIRIFLKFDLLDQIVLNNVPFYRFKIFTSSPKTFSVDAGIEKHKRTELTSAECLLRQVKLLESCRVSGEEEKLIGLIDKWESVRKEVLKQLYEHQIGESLSFKKFVTKLGLDYNKLEFDDDVDEDEDECVEDDEDEDEEHPSHYEGDNKRIKY